MNYWVGYLTILLMVGGGLLGLIAYSHKSNLPGILTNIVLMMFSLFIIFMMLEVCFKLFFAEPDSIGTLARENWRERYIGQEQLNSLGYRDVEWTDELVARKTKVMVVGDSYVYGDGIEYPEDRFSNQLGKLLGAGYAVFNVGKGGTNTNHHIQYIINYPFPPDILVLSYVINDIKGAMLEEQWLNRPRPQATGLPEIPLLTKNSYAFNFFYWRVARLLQANQPDLTWQWYLDAFNNPDSWWIHQQQLLSIYEGTQAEQIPLVVVVFPSMDHTEESLVVTEQIVYLFEEKGVPVLDVSTIIKDIPKKERMASAVDAHPSELVHRTVADALYQMFLEQELVK